MGTFKHINASQQIVNGTISTSLLAPGAVTSDKIDINANLDFNEFQALSLRLENVSINPAPGNPGRLVWNTTASEFFVDTGTSFVPLSVSSGVASLQIDSNPPLTGAIQFVAGTNITLFQLGQVVTISASGGGGSGTFAKDLFTIVTPSLLQYNLSFNPVANSEIVSWNGIVLRPGVSNDYIIVSSPSPQLQLSGFIVLHVGDTIQVTYAH